MNPCLSNPCLNGYCTQELNTYAFTCICNPGYTGLNCEIYIDQCQNIVCQNGGSCYTTGQSYKCACLQGYTGYDCSVVINQCYSYPCLNGGTCNFLGANNYNCNCLPGFYGTMYYYCLLILSIHSF